MPYDNFSRRLREKYSTRFHVADQLVDQLKSLDQTQILSTSVDESNQKNLLRAQQEISLPLISYLNQLDCKQSKPTENNHDKEFEPYFKECLLAAERIKNNQRSNRDRQICYENLLLTQKLDRIKKQSTESNHQQLLLSKAKMKKKPPPQFSNTRHSLSLNSSQSQSSLSVNDTAADVDISIESSEFESSPKQAERKTSDTPCEQTDRIYEHLNNIDMTMMRDTIPLMKRPNYRHFSICILPRDTPTTFAYRKCAFKQEILYH
ncbi:unnamed protein product [Adineta ricciae]|uniref:Uncharacterized protein n=1 Tax=Adineta ricciae TaxID=249248 RepID=A0A813QJN5_ADIRI|nr:unnamed protein product [Adineta ricciae]CAF1066088.1 unnamed protein product [Adineta ricciae]